MKNFPVRFFYHVLVLLPFFAFFFLVTPSHADAVSLYSPSSIYQRETVNNFEIRNPLKSTHYYVWVDGDHQVQQDPTSNANGSTITVPIKVRGVTGGSPKKVCLSDDPNILTASPGNFLNARASCKWSVSIYVTQNSAPTQNPEPLDSATNPTPKSRPDSGIEVVIDTSNFKENATIPVKLQNAQPGAQYYIWLDKWDSQPQVTTPRTGGNATYNLKAGRSGKEAKKVCVNDVELQSSDNGTAFPSNYECRWFVYVWVLANTPTEPGEAVNSKTNPTPKTRPRDSLQLRMDYTNYLRETNAGFHITYPSPDAQYYVWVEGDKTPQKTKKANSAGDEINDVINVRGESGSPKKVCLNDVPFSFSDNGGFFPVGYECRLYVLIKVSKESPADQGPEVNSKDNPQGNVSNPKTSPTPTPVPILPPCIEGKTEGGATVPIPTLRPDESNKAERDTAMSKIEKCTKVSSAIGDLSTEPYGFVLKLFQIFLSISGGIAMLIIIAAGYRYMTSQGNAEAIKAAQEQITSAIVGLLFLVFSMVILQIIGVDILQLPGLGK